MFIQEIIIDGFKSYAHRTVVEGFDPHFNAITGLNGSGKSNILDAICFVLGITNLSQVRAGNLSELVYKQGQAGVNKATVTIVFNNEDRSSSPVGYEQCPEVTVTRQVLLGGKSKYSINGRNAPAQQVQNLFHSVQLNVNNPHFLIMQGRITKVLNMKPHEILGMVEEAAGTRMYESRKTSALKTMEKKQAKVNEINAVLAEEITPTLERLRGEKDSYLKWSKNNADMERMERFVVAGQFVRAQAALQSNANDRAALEQQVKTLESKAADLQQQAADKEDEMQSRQFSGTSSTLDEDYATAKTTESSLSKDLVKAQSSWKNSQDAISKAEEEHQVALQVLDDAKSAVTTKETEIARETTAIDAARQAAATAESDLAQLTCQYQNMAAGISTSPQDRTLPEQIATSHAESKTAAAKVEQAQLKITHLTKELKTVEKEIKKESKSAEKLAAKKETAMAKVAEIRASIESLSFSADEYETLGNRRAELESTFTRLTEQVETLTAKLEGKLAFQYSDPVRGFDRSKVKGLVAKLLQVKDRKHSTALEVVAGGKLQQVVVDDTITAKALLDRGKLKSRVTIIPLDKVQTREVSLSAADQAVTIAKTHNANASPAIDLIDFDEEVRAAMEHVFGASIIADGAKVANQICDATKTRTVTLEGDAYDPSGTISGGSSGALGTILASLVQLADATSELRTAQAELKSVVTKLDATSAESAKFDKLTSKLDLAEAELASAEKHLSQTSFGMLVDNRETMLKEIEAARAEQVAMEQEKTEKWRLYEELKDQQVELTQQREARLGNIEAAIKAAKTKAQDSAKAARDAEARAQTLALELESLHAEVDAAQQGVDEALKLVEQAAGKEEDQQMKVGSLRASYVEAKLKLDEMENKREQLSSELTDLKKAKMSLTKGADKALLEAKKVSLAMERMQKERSNAETAVSSMLKKHAWIESEKTAFGVAGGDYDFEASDVSKMTAQLNKIKSDQESLAKKVNKKVMGMIEKAEGEYTELLRKRKVIENDKKKIENVIEGLDTQKKAELDRTWVKVNRDFGSIFTALLPGTQAKLEPPEGKAAWEGLEVKVAFGTVWKESLSELSGGQRSLLALSLILSLLLFKPAPMYILDEVDAALDLSHTQNIGNMLKTHFSQSQFIVVSLKEGMFNNANVIFRTKFVDGVSTVARTIGTGSSRARTSLSSANTTTAATTTTALDKSNSSRAKQKGKENSVGA